MRTGRSVVLTRRERDVLYDSVMLEFTGIDDIPLMLKVRRGAEARELRDQYINAMRLLDDLGCEHVDARDHYPLTMPKGQLVRTIRRHHGYAAGSLKDQAGFLREGRDPETTVEEWADFRAEAGRIVDDDLALMASARRCSRLWARSHRGGARKRCRRRDQGLLSRHCATVCATVHPCFTRARAVESGSVWL